MPEFTPFACFWWRLIQTWCGFAEQSWEQDFEEEMHAACRGWLVTRCIAQTIKINWEVEKSWNFAWKKEITHLKNPSSVYFMDNCREMLSNVESQSSVDDKGKCWICNTCLHTLEQGHGFNLAASQMCMLQVRKTGYILKVKSFLSFCWTIQIQKASSVWLFY